MTEPIVTLVEDRLTVAPPKNWWPAGLYAVANQSGLTLRHCCYDNPVPLQTLLDAPLGQMVVAPALRARWAELCEERDRLAAPFRPLEDPARWAGLTDGAGVVCRLAVPDDPRFRVGAVYAARKDLVGVSRPVPCPHGGAMDLEGYELVVSVYAGERLPPDWRETWPIRESLAFISGVWLAPGACVTHPTPGVRLPDQWRDWDVLCACFIAPAMPDVTVTDADVYQSNLKKLDEIEQRMRPR